MEDDPYRIVGEEIETGQKDTAAWARAFADGGGDEANVKSLYIKYRVRRLQDELSLAQADPDRASVDLSARNAQKQAHALPRAEEKESARAAKRQKRMQKEAERKRHIERTPEITVLWWLILISIFLAPFVLAIFNPQPHDWTIT